MYQIHVQADPSGLRYNSFELIVVRFARHVLNDAEPAENPAYMSVDGEAVCPERVGEHAPCRLRTDAGQTLKKQLGITNCALPQKLERQVTPVAAVRSNPEFSIYPVNLPE